MPSSSGPHVCQCWGPSPVPRLAQVLGSVRGPLPVPFLQDGLLSANQRGFLCPPELLLGPLALVCWLENICKQPCLCLAHPCGQSTLTIVPRLPES